LKKHSFSYNVLIIFLILFSCSGEDLVDNYQEPELRTIESVSTIFLGQNQKIVVRFFNLIGEEVKNPNLNWSSSDSTILDVNQDGSLVPKKVGNATITVSVETSDPKNPVKKTEFNIEVKSNVITIEPEVTETPELTISPPDSPIQKDEEIDLNYSFTDAETGNQLDPEMVSWASSDENIALVDENGTINGLTPGNVTITLTITYDDETYEEEFVVEVIVTPELSIGTEESTIRVNEILELNPIFKGFDGQEVEEVELIFSSDDNQIASVDEMGNITGVKAGKVEITITVTYEGQTYSKQVQLSVNLEPALIIQNSVATLTEGKSENITAIFTDEKGNENNQVTIQWESLTPELIEVDQDGNVQAVAAGEAKVKASLTYNDELFEKEITIQIEEKLIYTINLIEPINNLYEGNSSKLNFEIIDSKGQVVENPSVMWSSSEPTLVQVDQSGNIQGLTIGSSIITLTTEIDGTEYTEEHSLTIIPLPAISITNVIETLVEGESHRFVSKFDDQAEGENLSIETTWSSSDENVIEINEQGTITALKAGSAEIEVSTSYKGQQYSTKISISVTAKPQIVDPELIITSDISQLKVNNSENLSVLFTDDSGDEAETDVNWSSSDDSIISINQNGQIEAISIGTATITATTSYDGQEIEDTITIMVFVDPEVRITNDISRLELNDRVNLNYSYTDDSGQEQSPQSVSWESSDPSIVSVNSNGRITAIGIGSAEITVTTSEDNQTYTDTVTIQVFVTPKVSITNPAGGIIEGTSYDFDFSFTDDEGNTATPDSIEWDSGDENVLTIDNEGVVTTVGSGTSRITLTVTYDGSTYDTDFNFIIQENPNSNSGDETESFKGTLSGGYGLKGGYEVKAEGDDLLIILDANYSINSSLPDGALFLSNANRPNDGSIRVWYGKSHYKGPRTYTVENVGLRDYRYLVFWCIKFNTPVGAIKLFE